jgi:hypothetical protein
MGCTMANGRAEWVIELGIVNYMVLARVFYDDTYGIFNLIATYGSGCAATGINDENANNAMAMAL